MEQLILALDGTTAARTYLKNYYNRNLDTSLISTVKGVPKDALFSLIYQTSIDTFKALLRRWFVGCQLAFFMLKNTVFRDLITYLNTSLRTLLLKARVTLRKWIIAEYEERKAVLTVELQQSISKIYISFDIWTVGNWTGVISIWVY